MAPNIRFIHHSSQNPNEVTADPDPGDGKSQTPTNNTHTHTHQPPAFTMAPPLEPAVNFMTGAGVGLGPGPVHASPPNFSVPSSHIPARQSSMANHTNMGMGVGMGMAMGTPHLPRMTTHYPIMNTGAVIRRRSQSFSDSTVATALTSRRTVDAFRNTHGSDYQQQQDDADDDEEEYIDETRKSKFRAKGKVAVAAQTKKKRATPVKQTVKARPNRRHDNQTEREMAGERNGREIDEASGINDRNKWENEEHNFGTDDEGNDEDAEWNEDDETSKSNKNLPKGKAVDKTGKIISANGRVVGRKLVLWHRPRMIEKLIMHMWYELHRRGVPIPWDAIVHRLSPGSSGQTATQHLNKLRDQLVSEGHLVPPLCGKVSHDQEQFRGMIRDMTKESITATRNVPWTEQIEDRKESIINPGIIKGSGNYRKNPGGRGLDKAVKPKDGKRRTRNPTAEADQPDQPDQPVSGGTRSNRKRPAPEPELEDDGSEVRLDDLDLPTSSKKQQSTRTLRTRQVSRNTYDSQESPSSGRRSHMATMGSGFSQGARSNYRSDRGPEFDSSPTFKVENRTPSSEEDASEYLGSPTQQKSKRRTNRSAFATEHSSTGSNRFQNLNIFSPVAAPNFEAARTANPRSNARDEGRRQNREIRERMEEQNRRLTGMNSMQGRNSHHEQFDLRSSLGGMSRHHSMNNEAPKYPMGMAPMYPSDLSMGHGHPSGYNGGSMMSANLHMHMQQPIGYNAGRGLGGYNGDMIGGGMMYQPPNHMHSNANFKANVNANVNANANTNTNANAHNSGIEGAVGVLDFLGGLDVATPQAPAQQQPENAQQSTNNLPVGEGAPAKPHQDPKTSAEAADPFTSHENGHRQEENLAGEMLEDSLGREDATRKDDPDRPDFSMINDANRSPFDGDYGQGGGWDNEIGYAPWK